MKNFKIKLDGYFLQSAYVVYIIELIYTDNIYYYIGQTGDNHYITARPALRRLVGHLENKNRSTQNQLYKFIAYHILELPKRDKKEDFTPNEKMDIEQVLSQSIIEMHVYPLETFDLENHTIKRKAAQEFEKHILQLFMKNSQQLINKSTPKPKNSTPNYMEQYQAIVEDFGFD